jgi:hypothetical protein
MSLFAELANNTRVEIKVGSGDVDEQIRQIRGDAEGSAPAGSKPRTALRTRSRGLAARVTNWLLERSSRATSRHVATLAPDRWNSLGDWRSRIQIPAPRRKVIRSACSSGSMFARTMTFRPVGWSCWSGTLVPA